MNVLVVVGVYVVTSPIKPTFIPLGNWNISEDFWFGKKSDDPVSDFKFAIKLGVYLPLKKLNKKSGPSSN